MRSLALVLLSAGLLFAASPPLDCSPLVFLALVPLYELLFGGVRSGGAPPSRRLRRSFGLSYLTAVLFFTSHLYWLLHLSKEELTQPWLMIPALAVLALYLGLFPGLAALWSEWIRRRTGISPVWVFPVTWTLLDWARSVGETGFPWGSVGYALAPWPESIQLLEWAGYWCLPAWILLVNGLIWAAIHGRSLRFRGGPGQAFPAHVGVSPAGAGAPAPDLVRRALPPVLVFGLPILLGTWIVFNAPESVSIVDGSDREIAPTFSVDSNGNVSARGLVPNELPLPVKHERTSGFRPETGALRFSLIQANTPREVKWRDDYRETVVGDLLQRSRQASVAHAPDLIIWPETAAPMRVLWETALRDMIRAEVSETGVWTLVGSLDAKKVGEGYEHYNSAMLFDPSGVANQKFPKRHMVPFGELTPYKDLFPFLAEIDFGQSDFTAGTEPSLFSFVPGDVSRASGEALRTFSSLICFESTFPALARSDVQAGAEYLVNITNDFWYGRSAEPLQHAQFSILRAVENRTPLIRCANTGVSFVVDPYGRVHGATGLFETFLLTADVLPGTGGSLYTRWGDWFLWILFAGVLAMMLFGVVRARSSVPIDTNEV